MPDHLGSRQRLPEALADALQQEILGASLIPGDRLPSEAELANRFNVSRTVVREAARLLVQRGLVTVRPGRGMTVADFDGRFIAEQYGLLLRLSDGTFDQLLELRLVLEVEMAALAAARRSPEHLAELRRCNEQLSRSTQSRPEFLAADLDFHEVMAEASGNPFFRLVVGPINGFLRDTYSNGPGYPSEAHNTIEEHAEIEQAISSGDPARARYATERHLRRVFASRNRLLAAREEAKGAESTQSSQESRPGTG
ncbi:FadR/GntR family transcriptional regulator [Blastococcus sp. SYSU DS0617]